MWQADTIRTHLDSAFPGFEPELKDFISYSATLKSYSTGDTLVKKGSGLRTVMLVVKGNIKMLREARDEKEYFVYIVSPGEACALSLIGSSVDVWNEMHPIALGPTEVIHVPSNLMKDMMLKFATWDSFVLSTCNTRFKSLLQLLDSLTYRDLEERIIIYLRNMVEKLHARQLNITHQEIANDLNSSREVISRILKRIEQKGIIKSDRYCLEWLGKETESKESE